MKPRAFWPCIDSNAKQSKAQKGSKDINKIDHVISVIQFQP